MIGYKSGTNGTKWDETFLIKTTLVPLVPLFFKNKKTFSKNGEKTVLDIILIFFYQTVH